MTAPLPVLGEKHRDTLARTRSRMSAGEWGDEVANLREVEAHLRSRLSDIAHSINTKGYWEERCASCGGLGHFVMGDDQKVLCGRCKRGDERLATLTEHHAELMTDVVTIAKSLWSENAVEGLRQIEATVRALVAGEVVVVRRSEIIAEFGTSLCEGCEGSGDLSRHGVDGSCAMCDGTGRIEDELSRWLTPQTQEKS